MTPFRVVGVASLLLTALALALHAPTWFYATGLVALVTIIGFGVTLPRWRFFGPYVCRGNASRPRVALTFDDGPDPQSTPPLLDLLGAEGVPAAFFGVGERVAANPALAARIVCEGHLLENHSHAHSNYTNFFTIRRLRDELAQAQAAIQQATGIAPRWFRPPMGLTNEQVFRAAHAVGLTVVGWTARGLDTKLADPDQIVARIVRRLEPGAIILLHDGGIPSAKLLATVRSLLKALRALGYEVARLDQLLT